MATLKEQRRRDERERNRTMRQTQRELKALLTNMEGLKRLRAISDKEWAEAVAEDAGAG